MASTCFNLNPFHKQTLGSHLDLGGKRETSSGCFGPRVCVESFDLGGKKTMNSDCLSTCGREVVVEENVTKRPREEACVIGGVSCTRKDCMDEEAKVVTPTSVTDSCSRPRACVGVKPSIMSMAIPISSTRPCSASSLSRVWREIQGSDNWETLIKPLNPILQDEVIRYGEFVTACYKAFDLNSHSKRYLNCKFGKKNMFREVGMEGCGYEVTKYIYATPDIDIPTQNGTCCSRWIGYVAVATDDEVTRLGRRDVLVTFRGTVTNTEWIANFMSSLTPARLDPYNTLPDVKVESGFLSLYTSDDSSSRFGVGSCREQLLSEVARVLNKYKGEAMSITLAGHSMGSSLAVLHAYDIAELGINKNGVPITVFSFGGPRVGNSAFKERCEELGVKVLRVVNVNDPVTKLPGVFLNENFRVFGGGKYEMPWSCSCYAHLGVELALDFFAMHDPACVHDLGTYIRLLRSCPKEIRKESGNALWANVFGNISKELILSVQKFDTWQWQKAVRNVGDVVLWLIV